MDLDVVRQALATALSASGYTPYPALGGSPELPAVIINSPQRIQYHQSLEGHALIEMPVTLIVSRADEETAEALLNAAVSTTAGSFVSQLEAASGPWLYLLVVESGQFLEADLPSSAKALGVDITIRLLA